MSLVLNGSGTITGATTLASTITSPTLTTPVITSTLGVGGTTPSASGAGITFPATQSASTDANTLDDYEEGVWTPSLGSSGSTPTVSSYTDRLGIYTKVGNLVTATCSIRATLSNVGSGYPIITGLPFTAAGYLDGVALGLVTIANSVSSSNGGWYVAGTYVYAGTSMVYNLSSQAYMTFTVSYRVA